MTRTEVHILLRRPLNWQRYLSFSILIWALLLSGADRAIAMPDGSVPAKLLPNGWRVTPVGTHVKLDGDMPSKILISGNHPWLIVHTSGYHHEGVAVIDLRTKRIASALNLGHTFGGMAFDEKSRTIYVPGGGPADAEFKQRLIRHGEPAQGIHINLSLIHRIQFTDGALSELDPIHVDVPGTAHAPWISDVLTQPNGVIYAADMNNDAVYKISGEPLHVTVVGKTGYAPYKLAVSPDRRMIAVSNWGDASVTLLETDSLASKSLIPVGIHPNDLSFAPDGRLFVANAGSGTVTVLSPDGQVSESIRMSLSPNDGPGSNPNSLAISKTGSRLFVANAGDNNIAVVDISDRDESKILGFVPTGWYPSALAISTDARTLYVGTGKGLASSANPPNRGNPREAEPDPRAPYPYVGDQLQGNISIVDNPTGPRLKRYTSLVLRNTPSSSEDDRSSKQESVILTRVFPRIKHVLYIIRENRSYDQVLGDIGEGNSDPSLTLFGAKVTPNAHKIAREGVLFDNFYVNGDVSEEGHQWSNAAYATDFTDKTWLHSYSHRGEPKDADEDFFGINPRLTASPAGYLWDNCARHGVSYRTYGEFAWLVKDGSEEPVYSSSSLKGHASIAWLQKARPRNTTSGFVFDAVRDTELADVFIAELKDAELKGSWPSFMVMQLPEDHTAGLLPGAFTPQAMVASNDQALGKILEAVSHSKFWPETAVFVVEDDAQNGPDHVDCRRTVALLISPYVKRQLVDSTQYSTSSMLRTIELILGLPPMAEYDRRAKPMLKAFTSDPSFAPYIHAPAEMDINARNPRTGAGATASMQLDFSGLDRADPDKLNRILWQSIKPEVPFPSATRSAALLGVFDATY